MAFIRHAMKILSIAERFLFNIEFLVIISSIPKRSETNRRVNIFVISPPTDGFLTLHLKYLSASLGIDITARLRQSFNLQSKLWKFDPQNIHRTGIYLF